MDLISRLSELRCQYNCFDESERDAYHTLSEAIKALSDVPDTNVADCSDCIKHGGDWDCDHVHCHKGKSAQPERKKGKWIENGIYYQCPFCREEYDYIANWNGKRWRLCPMCGARMEEE